MGLMQRVRRLEALEEQWAATVDNVNGFDAVELAQRAGIVPDDWQARVLRSTAQFVAMNCSRQSGKSLVSAVLAAHMALTKAGSLTILVAPSLRQSTELFRRVVGVYRSAGETIPPDAESMMRLELRNGSRVLSLPGRDDAAVRGFSAVDLLIVDEASRVSDELYYSLRPVLAVSGGRLLALSTPFGARGWFYREWSEGGDEWERVHVTADDVPRITREFLEQERRSMGEWFWRQEFYGEFLDPLDSVFRTADIEAALTDEVAPLWPTPPALPAYVPPDEPVESGWVVVTP